MPHSYGYRARTRHLFSRDFRKHGMPGLSVYLKQYHIGDWVDIKANGAVHRGMPHRFYHGRTGVVYNVTPHAVGVIVNKRVRHRIIPKRINVRIEHIQPSKCRDDFLCRVKKNDVRRREAIKTESKKKLYLKRQPTGPRKGHWIKAKKNQLKTVTPIPYEILI
jgi:large subunit ribosomal protein L21e